jgi:hypothetical protein
MFKALVEIKIQSPRLANKSACQVSRIHLNQIISYMTSAHGWVVTLCHIPRNSNDEIILGKIYFDAEEQVVNWLEALEELSFSEYWCMTKCASFFDPISGATGLELTPKPLPKEIIEKLLGESLDDRIRRAKRTLKVKKFYLKYEFVFYRIFAILIMILMGVSADKIDFVDKFIELAGHFFAAFRR